MFHPADIGGARFSPVNGQPELFFKETWSPICGHWFWNNNNGADLFCKMKMHSSYATGRITTGEKFGSKLPITSAGLLLGICREDDADIGHCTGGNNWNKDKANTYCHAGRDDAGLKIICEGEWTQIHNPVVTFVPL